MPPPATSPVWNTDGTNRTTPSGAQQGTGWTLNQTGVSSFMNWWMYWVYQWILYFAARVFDGDVTINGNLTVTGTSALNGNVTSLGTVTGTDLKHTAERSKTLHPAMGAYTTTGSGYILGFTKVNDPAPPLVAGSSGVWEATAGSSACRQHMCLDAGSRFTKVKVRFENTSGGTASFDIMRYDMTTGIHSVLQSYAPAGQIIGNNIATLTLTTPVVLGENEDITVGCAVAAVADKLRAMQPYWNRP